MKNVNLHGYETVVNCYSAQEPYIDILVYCDDKDAEKVVEVFDNGLDDFYEDETICWGDAIVYRLNENDIDCYIDYATLKDNGYDTDEEWEALIAETIARAKHFRGHCYGSN